MKLTEMTPDKRPYVPNTQDGKVVDSQGFVLDAEEMMTGDVCFQG
jgi:hypothetical protein